MVAGMAYHHISRNNLQTQAQAYLSRSFEVIFTALLLLNGSLTILPPSSRETPSLFRAVFGAALKAIFGIGYAYLFLQFGFKSKSIIRAFLSHPILRVIGRLSYSVYIIQYSVIYAIYSNLSVPVTYSGFTSVSICWIAGLLISSWITVIFDIFYRCYSHHRYCLHHLPVDYCCILLLKYRLPTFWSRQLMGNFIYAHGMGNIWMKRHHNSCIVGDSK